MRSFLYGYDQQQAHLSAQELNFSAMRKEPIKVGFLRFTALTAPTAGRIILHIHGTGMLAKMANIAVAVKGSSWTSMFQSTKHVLRGSRPESRRLFAFPQT
jgi:hypothetical protein